MTRTRIVVALVILLILAALAVYSGNAIRADSSERSRYLPGDELISKSIFSVTHAISILRPPQAVWPWIAQMGSGRGGWYAYDFIDNGGQASARRILPEYQDIAVGSVFPALPGVKDVFVVSQFEADHHLVLAWRSPGGEYFTTWAFVLGEPQPGITRLIVRGNVGPNYHPFGLPQWFARLIAPSAHFIMERKQLLGIAGRAEGQP
jgi:hypothetical protein